ncbi:hypothetical protein [Shewanella sp. OMA3-2]|uniref:hypothetical protein n=1 Tax=Shewanella sp. OMA3-2 TaxID=2908650 RepID=UPI001F3CE90D|nr:hypothetical protein [Shewanella sp. OMA3-2]UJF21608.1 hypothetical protein L0B17_16320 [Shewanella sp. OMA3-2]
MAVTIDAIIAKWQQLLTNINPNDSAKEPESEPTNTLSLKAIAQTYLYHGIRSPLKQQLSYKVNTDNYHVIGREQAIVQINNAIELWRDNQGELSAIIAPFGSGVSTFIQNIIRQQQSSEPLLWLSFCKAPLSPKEAIATLYDCFDIQHEPQSITEAIRLINAEPKHIILLDDIHRLMQRQMGSYQALVTLATILMETRQRHCWIVGCETYVWQRLSSQYQITHFVKTLVQLKYFTQTELTTFITLHLADLGIYLPQENSDELDEEGDSALTIELNAIESHSKTLMKICQGHPKLALFILKLSIDEHKITKLSDLNSKDIFTIDTQALNSLDEESLFALAEIYVHGGLTVENLSIIFNMSIEESSLTLEFLSKQGLLITQYCESDFARHFYQIPPVLSKIVATHLLNHNKLFSL